MILNMTLSLGSQTRRLEGEKEQGAGGAKARAVETGPVGGMLRESQEEGLRGLMDSLQERSRPEERPL